MSTLTKISNVTVFAASGRVPAFLNQAVTDSVTAVNTLTSNSIAHDVVSDHAGDAFPPQSLIGLSSREYGPSGVKFFLTHYPVVVWKETYDNGDEHWQIAKSLAELTTSNLIVHKSLIV